MRISDGASPETEPIFVIVTRYTRNENEQPDIDYTGRAFVSWSPEHVTSWEEFELVAIWALTARIPDPSELLVELTRRKYPISLGLLETMVSTNQLSVA